LAPSDVLNTVGTAVDIILVLMPVYLKYFDSKCSEHIIEVLWIGLFGFFKFNVPIDFNQTFIICGIPMGNLKNQRSAS